MTTTFVNLRHGTTAEWAAANPILGNHEVGVEITGAGPNYVLLMKVGDGATRWGSLAYVGAGGGTPGPQGPAGATGPQGPAGPAGADGSGVSILGTLASSGDLPGSGSAGDAYLIGGHLWVWSVNSSTWIDAGLIQGPAGPTGPTGPTGPAGPAGASGATGATGPQGPAGAAGATGPAGPAGAAGATGAKGDKGDTGPAGSGGDPTFDGTFGADPTGVSACDTAWASAMASAKVLRIRAGTYRFNNEIPLNADVEIVGDGVTKTKLYSYTTTGNGMVVTGSSSLGSGNRLRMSGLTLEYKGTGQPTGKHGVLVKRHIAVSDVVVQKFTNDGIYFDTFTAGNVGTATFFTPWHNVTSQSNGRDGWAIRAGANAHLFWNCHGDKNGRYGVHHYNDSANGGGPTYANTWIGGQCAYNAFWGWYFESGTDIQALGIYAEYNCSVDNDNSPGYDQPALSTTDRRVDFYFADSVNRVKANLSAVLNNDSTHIRVPSAATCYSNRIEVTAGGLRYTPMCAAVSTSTATTLAQLVADHNALVNALKAGKVTG